MTDSDEVLGKIELYREIEAAIQERHEAQRVLAREIDALRLATKPTYPTDVQRDGIREAARRIREKIVPASHHGDPTPTYHVVVDGRRGFLAIRDGAPYTYRGPGRLWRFTNDDIEALLELVRAEGFEIAGWWQHGEGISVTVR